MARARRRRPPQAVQAAAPRDIPPELADPGAPAWLDQGAYHRYMRQRGWKMPACERLNVAASPANRRRSAVAGWATASGITTAVTYGTNTQPHPDWPQLRARGLCD